MRRSLSRPLLQAVEPAVHDQLLAARPGVAHDRGLADVARLLDDVELAERVDAPRLVDAWPASRCAGRARPGRSAASCRPGRRGGPASAAVTPPQREWPTTMMCWTCSTSAANWITERQLRSPCADDVGDVAVHEQLARQQVDQLVRRHPAVGAADPQVLRRPAAASSRVKKPGERCSVASAQRRLRSNSSSSWVVMSRSSCRAGAAPPPRAPSPRRASPAGRRGAARAGRDGARARRGSGAAAARCRAGVSYMSTSSFTSASFRPSRLPRSVRRSRVRSRAL